MSSEQSSSMQSPRCLVLMPMLAGYEAIRSVVARAIVRAEAEMCRLEVAMEDADWQHWLAESVLRANLVLVDVTDNNPFVMYELGLAHQRGLPTTLIINSGNERVPATVRGTPFLPYAADDLAGFEDSLVDILREMIQGLHSSSTHAAVHAEADGYADSYQEAVKLMALFRDESALPVIPVSRSEFFTRLSVAKHRGDWMPANQHKRQVARYLLARMISNSDDVRLMQAIEDWLRLTY